MAPAPAIGIAPQVVEVPMPEEIHERYLVVREVTTQDVVTVLALAIFGVGQAVALGYAVLYHASQFVPITLIGWLFLLREHVSLGEATRAPVT